jgi:hypothetical protein
MYGKKKRLISGLLRMYCRAGAAKAAREAKEWEKIAPGSPLAAVRRADAVQLALWGKSLPSALFAAFTSIS